MGDEMKSSGAELKDAFRVELVNVDAKTGMAFNVIPTRMYCSEYPDPTKEHRHYCTNGGDDRYRSITCGGYDIIRAKYELVDAESESNNKEISEAERRVAEAEKALAKAREALKQKQDKAKCLMNLSGSLVEEAMQGYEVRCFVEWRKCASVSGGKDEWNVQRHLVPNGSFPELSVEKKMYGVFLGVCSEEKLDWCKRQILVTAQSNIKKAIDRKYNEYLRESGKLRKQDEEMSAALMNLGK